MENSSRKHYIFFGVIAFIIAVIMFFVGYLFFCGRYERTLEFAKNHSKLIEVASILDERYIGDYDSGEFDDAVAAAMVSAIGDRWSYYMTAEEYLDYVDTMTNSYVGIGVTVTKADGEYVRVTAVTPGSGAEAAGVEVGDMIKAVDGSDVLGVALDEVKNLILGDSGTTVSLTLLKADGSEETVEAERRVIETAAVAGEMIDGVGYVKISNFHRGAGDEIIETTNSLLDSGAGSIVYDVRFNGGGYLDELLKALDYLLPEGTIFVTEDINGQRYTEESDAECINVPIAVLVNDSTYSAAEYFAETLREFGRATVVGQQTTGKGYSQQVFYLSDGSAINLSTMKYFTPDGTCLAGVGITPDVPVDISDEEYVGVYLGTLTHGEDTQLQAAVESVK